MRDFGPQDDGEHSDPIDLTGVPCSIEMEQAMLGCLLYDSTRGFEVIPAYFRPEHIYEPFHARLYAAMVEQASTGATVDINVLIQRFVGDKALEELGGLAYLGDLIDRAPPAGEAGRYAQSLYDLSLRRQLLHIGEHWAKAAYHDREVDAKVLIEEMEAALYQLRAGQDDAGPTAFADVLGEAIEMAAAAYARDGSLAGISTGFMDLDNKIAGLVATNLVILAGRPAMGKTALATNIAFHAARTHEVERQPDGEMKTVRGGVVGFFSLEMSAGQLGLRILADVAGVPSERITKGEFDVSEFSRLVDSAAEVQSIPLYVDDTGGVSLAQIATRARRMKRTVGLDLLIVDYLQLISVDGAKNEQETVGRASVGLKALAKELNCCVLALSQVSRDVEKREDKRPQLSDLRSSGNIEQDADQVLFVYREVYYLENKPPKEGTPEYLDWEDKVDQLREVAEVIVGKQRHGPIGTVKLGFSAKTTKFYQRAKDSL